MGPALPRCGLYDRELPSCFMGKLATLERFLLDLRALCSEHLRQASTLGGLWGEKKTHQSCNFQLASDWLAVGVERGQGGWGGRGERESVSHWLSPDSGSFQHTGCPRVCPGWTTAEDRPQGYEDLMSGGSGRRTGALQQRPLGHFLLRGCVCVCLNCCTTQH